jgi:prepilin peptidase dependent protein B
MLSQRRLQRGMTLIELMVSIAVGLFLLMIITQFFVGQVIGNSELLKVTRLNQELRAIMDLAVRDIRRGGYWANAISGVWYEESPGVTANPLQSITIDSTVNPTTAASGSSFTYAYDVNGNGAIEDSENLTIRLNSDKHSVELVQGITNPTTTTLSDTGATTITGLSFSLAPVVVTIGCVVAGSNPTLTMRQLVIVVTGQLASDSTVSRTMRETIRLRTDPIVGSCPAVIT